MSQTPTTPLRVVMQDGRWRPDGRLRLDVEDLGLARGLSVFETMRSYQGGLPLLSAHLDRLQRSAQALQIPWPGADALESELRRCLVRARRAKRPAPDVRLRIGLTPTTRFLLVQELEAAPASVRAVTRPAPVQPWLSGRIKHTSRAGSLLVVRAAAVEEVLWLGPQGELLEGTWSNVFAVRGGRLFTPPDDGRILAGVTRAGVLEQARALGIPTEEGPIGPADGWEELYISSSLKLLCPIVELDGVRAPGLGPVGAMIREALFEALCRSGRAWAKAGHQA